MFSFSRIAPGAYRSSLAPVEIHKTGSGKRPWIVCVIANGRGYSVETFPTLADAQGFAAPLAAHPQAVAACEGFAALAARKLEGFGGHGRAARHTARMASYVAAWRTREHTNGAHVQTLAQGTKPAFVLMASAPGGDGFPHFAQVAPDTCPNTSADCRTPGCVHTVEGAKQSTTTPDNAGERIAAGSLIAELAGDDYVTTNEAAEVIEWCQEWARDCEGGHLFTVNDANLLHVSNRLIDGGLAFVLADIRRVASESVRSVEGDGIAYHGEPTAEDIAEAMQEDDKPGTCRTCGRACGDTTRPRLCCLQGDDMSDSEPCDCGGVTGESGRYVQHAPGAPGCLDRSTAAIAARIAADAARAWQYDPDVSDADSAAQDVADLLRDLATQADRMTLLHRVFGLPSEECHSYNEHRDITRAGNPAADWTRYHELAKEGRKEKGAPDVALELVSAYADDIAPVAFDGHEAGDGFGESTNLSSWKEARAAFDAVNVAAHHTFGGMALDGYRGELDKLARVALEAQAEAVRYALWNAGFCEAPQD